MTVTSRTMTSRTVTSRLRGALTGAALLTAAVIALPAGLQAQAAQGQQQGGQAQRPPQPGILGEADTAIREAHDGIRDIGRRITEALRTLRGNGSQAPDVDAARQSVIGLADELAELGQRMADTGDIAEALTRTSEFATERLRELQTDTSLSSQDRDTFANGYRDIIQRVGRLNEQRPGLLRSIDGLIERARIADRIAAERQRLNAVRDAVATLERAFNDLRAGLDTLARVLPQAPSN